MKLEPLYEVKLVEQDDQHYYTIGDDPTYRQGVTGILGVISKFALLPWTAKVTAEYIRSILLKTRGKGEFTDRFLETLVKRSKKQPRFVKEKAATIGSNAHTLFDRFIKEKMELSDSPYKESFLHWVKTEKLKIISGDIKIGSLQHSYGGSLDAVGEDEEGNLWIADFKTGKNIWDTHAYQVGAYAQAMKETYGLDKLPNGVIIRFEKGKPQYERKEILNMSDCFNTFLHAKSLFEAERRDKFVNRQLVKEKKEKKK